MHELMEEFSRLLSAYIKARDALAEDIRSGDTNQTKLIPLVDEACYDLFEYVEKIARGEQ